MKSTTMRQQAERDAKRFFAVTHGTANYRAEEKFGTRSRARCLRCEGDCCDPFDTRIKCSRCNGTGCEDRA